MSDDTLNRPSVGSTPQRLGALERANSVRAEMGQIKRELARCQTCLGDALRDPRSASLTIHELLIAQWRWGPIKARQTLRAAGVRENLRVRNLTDHQRAVIEACARASQPRRNRLVGRKVP